MPKKINKIQKNNITHTDNKPDYKIELEKLKDELTEHEKNNAILKSEIAELEEIIKLGSITPSKDSL